MVRKKSSCRSAAASPKYHAPQTFPENTRSTSALSRRAQRGGAVLTGGMDDACQRWKIGLHRGDQAGDVVRIADIGRDHPDSAAVLLRSAAMRCCVASPGCAPAGQHQTAEHRARPGIRRSPGPPNPARRSPDTLHRNAIPVVPGSAARSAGPVGERGWSCSRMAIWSSPARSRA